MNIFSYLEFWLPPTTNLTIFRAWVPLCDSIELSSAEFPSLLIPLSGDSIWRTAVDELIIFNSFIKQVWVEGNG